MALCCLCEDTALASLCTGHRQSASLLGAHWSAVALLKEMKRMNVKRLSEGADMWGA